MDIVSSLLENIIRPDTKLIVSDLDYTLIDFGQGHEKGLEAAAAIVGADIMKKVGTIFHIIQSEHTYSHLAAWDKKEVFESLMTTFAESQQSSRYGIRKWSRELWIIAAAKSCEISLSQDQVIHARDAYWDTLRMHSPWYPDTISFIQEIQEKNIGLCIMTGSDSVMKQAPDNLLLYDAQFSWDYKAKHVRGYKLPFSDLFIGDPVDKPDRAYFEKIFTSIADEGKYDKEEIVFIGDSPKADLMVPEENGFRTVLIKRTKVR
jgi:FMN phosphatase YigB (HAD superfamily)